MDGTRPEYNISEKENEKIEMFWANFSWLPHCAEEFRTAQVVCYEQPVQEKSEDLQIHCVMQFPPRFHSIRAWEPCDLDAFKTVI